MGRTHDRLVTALHDVIAQKQGESFNAKNRIIHRCFKSGIYTAKFYKTPASVLKKHTTEVDFLSCLPVLVAKQLQTKHWNVGESTILRAV